MNALRHEGYDLRTAVLQGNRDRLRPILMTTLALVGGMLPLWVGTGPGSEERRAIAVVVIGGQTLSLLLTLLVTPVAYLLLDDLIRMLTGRRSRAAPEATTPHHGGGGPADRDRGHEPRERGAERRRPAAGAGPADRRTRGRSPRSRARSEPSPRRPSVRPGGLRLARAGLFQDHVQRTENRHLTRGARPLAEARTRQAVGPGKPARATVGCTAGV